MITAVLIFAQHGFSQMLPDTCVASTWSTNGRVTSIVPVGDIVYIGGLFTKIGRYTGGNAIFDMATGATEMVFQKQFSETNAICPDEKGGWFLGGSFPKWGGQFIIHIFSDGAIDTTWKTKLFGDRINAIIKRGDSLFVAGNNLVNDASVKWSNVAVLDATTGLLITAWNPKINKTVNTIAIHENIMYVGGTFDSVGGRKQCNIAALDLTTGNALSWNPAPNPTGYVFALAVSGKVVYAGGVFITIGGQGGPFFAALDSSSATALSWNVSPNNSVGTIVTNGNNVYIGGNFTKISGLDRNHIARLDASTGLVTGWDPNADSIVRTMVLNGNTLFAGGIFTKIGGQTRNHIAALDVSTGASSAWNPDLDSAVNAIAVYGSHVYVGGDFTLIGAKSRNFIAALDPKTGQATPWDLGIKGVIVASIATIGNTIYAGGIFDTAGGQPRKNIAAFDAATGNITAWNPRVSASLGNRGYVYKIATGGNTVFIFGEIDSVNGQYRKRIASIDATTGGVTAWSPTIKDQNGNTNIYGICVKSNSLFVCGFIDSVNSQPRHGIAAFDVATGDLNSWNPKLSCIGCQTTSSSCLSVKIIDFNDSNIYITGSFDYVNGQLVPADSMSGLACISKIILDVKTGTAVPWHFETTGALNVMLRIDTIVYAGGSFTDIGPVIYSQRRLGLAAVASSTWFPLSWNPTVTNTVTSDLTINAMVKYGNAMYVGGNFNSIGKQERPYFAQFGNYSPLVQTRHDIKKVVFVETIALRGKSVRYKLESQNHVQLSVFDLRGRKITLVNKTQAPGSYSYDLRNCRLCEGLYVLRFEAGNTKATRVMTVAGP